MSTCFTNLRLRYDFHNSYPFVKKYLNLVSFILHASAHSVKVCKVNGNCFKSSTNQNWTGSYHIYTEIFVPEKYILTWFYQNRKLLNFAKLTFQRSILKDRLHLIRWTVRFYTRPSVFWRSMIRLISGTKRIIHNHTTAVSSTHKISIKMFQGIFQ